MEEGDNLYVSKAEETCETDEIGGEGEERGSGGEGTKGRGSGRTKRGEKPSRGDAIVGLEKARERRRSESPHGR